MRRLEGWDSGVARYTVYILQSETTGRFYVGSTNDLRRRLHDHNAALGGWTRAKGPWKLVYCEEYRTRAEAVAREKQLKAMKSRAYLERLVETQRRNRSGLQR